MVGTKLIQRGLIAALFDEATNTIEVKSTIRSAISFIHNHEDDLGRQAYSTKAMQNAFNNKTLRYVYIEEFKDQGNFILTRMMMDIREREVETEMIKAGLNVVRRKNRIHFHISAIKPFFKKHKLFPYQVKVRTSKYKIYYVQQHFSTMSEAEAYIANTSLTQIVQATCGKDTMYKRTTNDKTLTLEEV